MPRKNSTRMAKALRGLSNRKTGKWKARLAGKVGITRLQIAAIEHEFAREQPSPAMLDDWVEAKAILHGLDKGDIEKTVEGLLSEFDGEIGQASHLHAQAVARALGATRTKAIQAIKEALEATVDIYATVEGERVLAGSSPDHKTRLRAAELFGDMYGFKMPSKMEVEHDIGDNLTRLEEGELKVRLLEAQETLKFLEEAAAQAKRKQLPPPIDITCTTIKKDKRGGKPN